VCIHTGLLHRILYGENYNNLLKFPSFSRVDLFVVRNDAEQ
jgi:hypothetical protein